LNFDTCLNVFWKNLDWSMRTHGVCYAILKGCISSGPARQPAMRKQHSVKDQQTSN
jgi:hypothetical protein